MFKFSGSSSKTIFKGAIFFLLAYFDEILFRSYTQLVVIGLTCYTTNGLHFNSHSLLLIVFLTNFHCVAILKYPTPYVYVHCTSANNGNGFVKRESVDDLYRHFKYA